MDLGHRLSERCCHDLHVHHTLPSPLPLAGIVLPSLRSVARRRDLSWVPSGRPSPTTASRRRCRTSRSHCGPQWGDVRIRRNGFDSSDSSSLVMIASRDRQACLDDYIGEAWMVITNFPLSRTNKVCTNVALDCLHAISSRRQRSSPETPSESIDISAPEVQEPGRVASDMLSAAEKLGIITPASAPVLRSVWVDALDCATAAQRHNTSPTAVRARCSRASRAMRQHRDELLAAS